MADVTSDNNRGAAKIRSNLSFFYEWIGVQQPLYAKTLEEV